MTKRHFLDVWREENRREPWRVQCEDCVLGFRSEAQARLFVGNYRVLTKAVTEKTPIGVELKRP